MLLKLTKLDSHVQETYCILHLHTSIHTKTERALKFNNQTDVKTSNADIKLIKLGLCA